MAGLAVRRVRRLVIGGATVSSTGMATSPFDWAGGVTTGLFNGTLDGIGPLACSGGSSLTYCSCALLLLGGGFVSPAVGRGGAVSAVLTGGGGGIHSDSQGFVCWKAHAARCRSERVEIRLIPVCT